MTEVNIYNANVFLPGCLGPVRREVVLADDHQEVVQALRAENERLQTISDNYCSLLMDANAEL